MDERLEADGDEEAAATAAAAAAAYDAVWRCEMGDLVEFVRWGAGGFKVMGGQNASFNGGQSAVHIIYMPVEWTEPQLCTGCSMI